MVLGTAGYITYVMDHMTDWPSDTCTSVMARAKLLHTFAKQSLTAMKIEYKLQEWFDGTMSGVWV